MVEEKDVLEALKKVYDPELGINIVDLGFIYKIDIQRNKVNVRMTFTSPHCPLHGMITDQVRNEILKIRGIREVNVDLVFDPPWNVNMLSKEIKKKLGV